MIKTNIEIDNLIDIDKRKVNLPNNLDYFSITISYLIKDFANKNNISIEEIVKDINDHISIVQHYK